MTKTTHNIVDGKYRLYVQGTSIGLGLSKNDDGKDHGPWYWLGDWAEFKSEVEAALKDHAQMILGCLFTEQLKAELERRETIK